MKRENLYKLMGTLSTHTVICATKIIKLTGEERLIELQDRPYSKPSQRYAVMDWHPRLGELKSTHSNAGAALDSFKEYVDLYTDNGDKLEVFKLECDECGASPAIPCSGKYSEYSEGGSQNWFANLCVQHS